MKTSKCLMTWGLLSWLALSLPACSGDEVPEALSGTEQTAQASQGQITLKIQAPVPESVVLTKAYQTAEEARVYQLGIYIFAKGTGEGDADSNYTFLEYRSFGDLNDNKSLVGENGTGTFVTNIPIESGWKGKTIKVLLTANEPVITTLTEGTTTLADFKKELLNRVAADQNDTDVLVMNNAGRGTRMQFPMSATAYRYESGNPQEITIPEGDNPSITLAASLVRCLARVDVFNDTPNLTITGIRTFQACDKGLLFPTGGGVLQPTDVAMPKISLKPLISYFNGAATIPYVTPVNPDDVNSRRAANTRTAFYLCEQDVDAAATSPVVSIGYTLDIEGKSKPGMVSVYFKDGTNFQDVKRNTLYRIRLGDGTKVDSDMSVRIEVDDWDSEEIYAVLDPSTDADQ